MPVTSFHPTRIPNVRSWETFSTPLAHRYTFFTIPLKRRASSSWRAGASTSSIPAAYAGSFAFLFTMLMARLSPVRCAALAPLPRLRLRFSCRLSAFFLSPPAIGRCTCERAGWSLSAPRAQGIPLAPKGGSGRQCAAASGCGGAAGPICEHAPRGFRLRFGAPYPGAVRRSARRRADRRRAAAERRWQWRAVLDRLCLRATVCDV